MQLSELRYYDILFKYSKNEIGNIVFAKIPKDNLKENYDVAILFGGTSMIPYRADGAIKLYLAKRVRKIIITGGIGFLSLDRHNIEAIKLQNYLLSKGVSADDILIEGHSRNTRENIKNSVELIAKNFPSEYLSIVLISSDFHLRRCLALFKHYSNHSNVALYPIYDSFSDYCHWQQSFKSIKLIYTEALLLCYYAKRHLIDLKIDI